MQSIKRKMLLSIGLWLFAGIAFSYAQIAPEYFSGEWGDNGTKIYIRGSSVTVVMATNSGRPNGSGVVNADGSISVNFPDDRTYVGRLVSINQLNWGPGNDWYRSRLTPSDFAGDWGNNGTKIYVQGNSVTVVMPPSSGRPRAMGSVNGDGSITVNFPDDRTYVGRLVSINQINWGPNNNWFRSLGTYGYYSK